MLTVRRRPKQWVVLMWEGTNRLIGFVGLGDRQKIAAFVSLHFSMEVSIVRQELTGWRDKTTEELKAIEPGTVVPMDDEPPEAQ